MSRSITLSSQSLRGQTTLEDLQEALHASGAIVGYGLMDKRIGPVTADLGPTL